MTIDKKAKLEEYKAAYQKGQAQVRSLTENLLRMEGGIALLADLIADEAKSAAAPEAASPETPNA